VDIAATLSNPDFESRRLLDLPVVVRPKRTLPRRRPVRQLQKRLTAGETEQFIDLYRQGLAVKDMAEQFGVHRTAVRRC
jgi:hypothetical protein